MTIDYNARVIDWMCCPDCGCNVMRAESLKHDGSPAGAIECVCCGFAVLDVDAGNEHVYQDWAAICERVGHSWMPVAYTPDGDHDLMCVYCGKRFTT